jgi:hypothetical protein
MALRHHFSRQVGCLVPGLSTIPIDAITSTLHYSTLELCCLEALAKRLCGPIKDENSVNHHGQAATDEALSPLAGSPARAARKRIRDFDP